MEKVLRNRRAREPAAQLSCVPCSIPPPTPRQSRKGSAVQDFDCCPVLHFALVCEKEMRFFFPPSVLFLLLQCSPGLRGAVTRVGQQGRSPPFAPLSPRTAPDRLLGKSFWLGHSPFWHRRFQGLWSQHRQRAASGTRGQDLPGNRSSYAVAGNLQLHPKVAFSRKAAGQFPRSLAKHALAVDGGGSLLGYLQVNHIHKLISACRSKGVPTSRSPKDTPGFWSLTVSFERFRRMQVP